MTVQKMTSMRVSTTPVGLQPVVNVNVDVVRDALSLLLTLITHILYKKGGGEQQTYRIERG